jgi:hypothetical protein
VMYVEICLSVRYGPHLIVRHVVPAVDCYQYVMHKIIYLWYGPLDFVLSLRRLTFTYFLSPIL